MTASFRDPAGSLFHFQGGIFRVVNPVGEADLAAFLGSPRAAQWMASGAIAGTRRLSPAEADGLLADPSVQALFEARRGQILLEHERIAFPSFPYEWPPEMLHAAATLTLDLAQDLLRDHLGMKDGTPYNVLFRGPQPVFIDILSFERRDPGDATWVPYSQFVRTFLLPLLANKYYGLALDQILTTRRDGLEPEEVYAWTTLAQRIRPPFLSLVSLPAWLGRKHQPDAASIYRHMTFADPEKARFILNTLLNGLRRTLRRLQPAESKTSAWSDYTIGCNYTAEHFTAKERFVRQALAEYSPKTVLDVGCNTGHFSALAAQSGAAVVALDYDPVVLGQVWRKARAEKRDILPLAVNLTRPTPGIGWRNQECPSFLERARGKFDAVLMLAVIHHMLVTERVPPAEILELAAELTTGILIVEFIGPDDSMFRRITRGREELHKDLTPELFETLCRRRFEIVRTQHVEGSARWLYLLKKI